MTSAIYDFAAIAKLARFRDTPPQDQVKAVDKPVYRPEEESHLVYDYAQGTFPADYSGWSMPAGWSIPDGTIPVASWVVDLLDKVIDEAEVRRITVQAKAANAAEIAERCAAHALMDPIEASEGVFWSAADGRYLPIDED